MAQLRDPVAGCPWDREQTFATILPYTLEEAYEVADAIDQNDMAALRAELGDLLFQVVFHARMAEEAGEFSFDDVVAGICDKLTRRHPHVFGDAKISDAEAQTRVWEQYKQAERQAKAIEDQRPASILDDVPRALPGLLRAVKLQRRAARVGVDWPDLGPVLAKIEEELQEIREELASGADHARMTHEVGDLLFACANLARHVSVDPEVAMRGINERFEWRFRRIEALLQAQGRSVEQSTLEEMDALWDQAKAEERAGK
jgi:MazG family protein